MYFLLLLLLFTIHFLSGPEPQVWKLAGQLGHGNERTLGDEADPNCASVEREEGYYMTQILSGQGYFRSCFHKMGRQESNCMYHSRRAWMDIWIRVGHFLKAILKPKKFTLICLNYELTSHVPHVLMTRGLVLIICQPARIR